jgi:hypothetical protein
MHLVDTSCHLLFLDLLSRAKCPSAQEDIFLSESVIAYGTCGVTSVRHKSVQQPEQQPDEPSSAH